MATVFAFTALNGPAVVAYYPMFWGIFSYAADQVLKRPKLSGSHVRFCLLALSGVVLLIVAAIEAIHAPR